jgi:hypothetical protein
MKLTCERNLLFLFVRYSYLQVSLPLFNTFLILLRIIPSLCHPHRHAPLSRHPTLTDCRAAQRSSPQYLPPNNLPYLESNWPMFCVHQRVVITLVN